MECGVFFRAEMRHSSGVAGGDDASGSEDFLALALVLFELGGSGEAGVDCEVDAV